MTIMKKIYYLQSSASWWAFARLRTIIDTHETYALVSYPIDNYPTACLDQQSPVSTW